MDANVMIERLNDRQQSCTGQLCFGRMT